VLHWWIGGQAAEQIATIIVQSGLDALQRVDFDLSYAFPRESDDGTDLLECQRRLS